MKLEVKMSKLIEGNCEYKGCKYNQEGCRCNDIDHLERFKESVIEKYKYFTCYESKPIENKCICGQDLLYTSENHEYAGSEITETKRYCPVCN